MAVVYENLVEVAYWWHAQEIKARAWFDRGMDGPWPQEHRAALIRAIKTTLEDSGPRWTITEVVDDPMEFTVSVAVSIEDGVAKGKLNALQVSIGLSSVVFYPSWP